MNQCLVLIAPNTNASTTITNLSGSILAFPNAYAPINIAVDSLTGNLVLATQYGTELGGAPISGTTPAAIRLNTQGALNLTFSVTAATGSSVVPTAVATGPAGVVWMLDGAAARVVCYNSTGSLINSVTLDSIGVGLTARPNVDGFWVGVGSIIAHYASNGTRLASQSTSGLSNVSALAVDSSNNVHAADGTTGVVYKFDAATSGVTKFTPPSTTTPVAITALAVDSRGQLYAADPNNQRVLVWNGDGSFNTAITNSNQTVNPTLSAPRAVAIAASDVLVVGDTGNR